MKVDFRPADDGGKGFVVFECSTGAVIARVRLKGEAQGLSRLLDWLWEECSESTLGEVGQVLRRRLGM